MHKLSPIFQPEMGLCFYWGLKTGDNRRKKEWKKLVCQKLKTIRWIMLRVDDNQS